MATRADHFAIVIGIDSYPQLRPLKAATADAARFVEWLLSSEGGNLPPENVKLIVSPPLPPSHPLDAEPIQKDIDLALWEFGAEVKPKIGVRLYFYFAGHGVGPTVNEVGMLMADAAMSRLNSNIGLRPYLEYFQATGKFDEVIFIVDCCRDPVRSVSTRGPIFTQGEPIPGVHVVDLVILAAGYGEKAFEPADVDTKERRGLLTEVLLEGLQSPEAANARGEITGYALSRYVKERLPLRTTGDPKLRQEPEIKLGISDPELVLCTIAPQQIEVHVHGPPGVAGELVLYHGTDMSELGRCAASQAQPWILQLNRSSRYELELEGTDLTVILDPRDKDSPYVYHVPRP
jgi:hypothetical protein